MSILSRWKNRLVARKRLKAAAHRRYEKSSTHETAAVVRAREKQVSFAKRVLKRHAGDLRDNAYSHAQSLIGVMESGGNNTGPTVNKIIRANRGSIGEPWCGDFCAYVYRLAGSKAVTRSWASVSSLGSLSGVKHLKHPARGDLVRFKFDHVGMYVADHGSTIETIEGNTGRSGAVSDSRTGGDGVYRKRRDKHLVKDYLRITR